MNSPDVSRRRRAAIDCLLIFLLAAVLIRPLFQATYLNRWDAIESTFAADGRFLRDHGPHPLWQPLWYLGTRFDYIYPPALRYGTALLSHIWPPVRAYHIYAALFFCVGIAGVYFFVWRISRARGAAWLAAAAAALLSPSFLFLTAPREDAMLLRMPQRLGVLLRYGEGPHISALGLLPITLALLFRGLEPKRRGSLALAAVGCALVVSHNFYGATALAILFCVAVWSVWVTSRDHRVWARAAAIAGLTYGLTAFWLTPSYLRITTANLRFVSEPANAWSAALTAAVLGLFLAISYRLAHGRRAMAYGLFLCGSVLLFGLIVIGHYWMGLRVSGNAARLVPELDLVLILAAVEGGRRFWRRGWGTRVVLGYLVAISLASAGKWVAKAWTVYPPEPDFRQRVEYRMQDWVARHLPGARTMATGSIRFWFDTWHDLPQIGGGSEQGVLNPNVMAAQSEIVFGKDPELSLAWLQALGVDAIIVPGERSQEVFHDFVHPEKFAGILPALYDDGAGNVVYQVPRRYPGLARVIDRAAFGGLPTARLEVRADDLQRYARAIERGSTAPAQARWVDTETLEVRARVGEGQSILVQESYDPYWRAYAGEQRLPVRRDPLGLIVVDAPPGEQEIRLAFELPLENLVGRILTGISLGIVGLLLVMRYWEG
ncbi:MAG TPA: hypothetical protein VG672_12030 [Bryobacteraceae bacterium]|nr:hypothetical protein [Bryobacteraceae bacterium]